MGGGGGGGGGARRGGGGLHFVGECGMSFPLLTIAAFCPRGVHFPADLIGRPKEDKDKGSAAGTFESASVP